MINVMSEPLTTECGCTREQFVLLSLPVADGGGEQLFCYVEGLGAIAYRMEGV